MSHTIAFPSEESHPVNREIAILDCAMIHVCGLVDIVHVVFQMRGNPKALFTVHAFLEFEMISYMMTMTGLVEAVLHSCFRHTCIGILL
jgi:hypothetical protein